MFSNLFNRTTSQKFDPLVEELDICEELSQEELDNVVGGVLIGQDVGLVNLLTQNSTAAFGNSETNSQVTHSTNLDSGSQIEIKVLF